MDKQPIFTMELCKSDAKIVTPVINQGIDSRLEGFTQSRFYWTSEYKLMCEIADYHELQIMIRRLAEYDTLESNEIASAIISIVFGVDTFEY